MIKRNAKRWSILGVIGGLVLALNTASAQSGQSFEEVRQGSSLLHQTYQKVYRHYNEVLRNALVVGLSSDLFFVAERRWPSDLEELMRSPYFPEVGELINPYDGLPVTQARNVREVALAVPGVTGAAIEAYERGSAAPGQIIYEQKPDGSLMIRPLLVREDDPGHLRAVFMDLRPDPMLNTESGPAFYREAREEWVRWHANLKNLDVRARKSFANCWYINGMMVTVTNLGYEIPLSASQLFANPLVLPVQNPYTGAPIKAVSLSAPSPGDLTYIGIYSNRYSPPRAFSGGISLCYDGSGRVVNRLEEDTLRRYLDREARIARGEIGYFRKDGSPVTKLLHIE